MFRAAQSNPLDDAVGKSASMSNCGSPAALRLRIKSGNDTVLIRVV